MPEGHVIHRLANTFQEDFADHEVRVSSPQGRFADEAAVLDGHTLTGAEAVGKHLFINFDVPGANRVHIHLGLIGKLGFAPVAEPVGQVRLRIVADDRAADLRGPQWCRLITEDQYQKVLADSGPDPLRGDADPARGWARIRRSGKSIASLLLDQRVAAGVGNIFRAEVLFRHGIDPTTPGREIDEATWKVLWEDLVGLMAVALERGRIDTVADEHGPEAQERPPRVDAHGGEVYVYRRAGQPCLVCGTEVCTTVLEGRNLYWCSRCQRSHRASD